VSLPCGPTFRLAFSDDKELQTERVFLGLFIAQNITHSCGDGIFEVNTLSLDEGTSNWIEQLQFILVSILHPMLWI
jgi:hypothetical protein